MTTQEYQAAYHSMPAKYRKHGDMPALVDMCEDVDAYRHTTRMLEILERNVCPQCNKNTVFLSDVCMACARKNHKAATA